MHSSSLDHFDALTMDPSHGGGGMTGKGWIKTHYYRILCSRLFYELFLLWIGSPHGWSLAYRQKDYSTYSCADFSRYRRCPFEFSAGKSRWFH